MKIFLVRRKKDTPVVGTQSLRVGALKLRETRMRLIPICIDNDVILPLRNLFTARWHIFDVLGIDYVIVETGGWTGVRYP